MQCLTQYKFTNAESTLAILRCVDGIDNKFMQCKAKMTYHILCLCSSKASENFFHISVKNSTFPVEFKKD